mmetsp:Transcript_7887/g.10829  ORF Transcript_7887/g.10829 Transcript_7887/m.10829 type:complete len:141 (-) Transcript_7887:167-589(-)|eukprot:CAMPEP_0185263352 /NCGR_PEP_ID=MMETSP1359-20130426/14402_1 /TAXON_ID=552665 /ORGANISM="Bigelowiella longifila, Strain CCMP242" /LENGTH=140 /DNA_ID=CAMNT_0027850829 /DNA_START=14 /DNA_END=436 /DNA_ORIENTATION=+
MGGDDTKKAAASAKPAKFISMEEVKKHTKVKDLWFVIHGKVYDVTKYVEDHPGGLEVMQDNAGKDVSDQFEEFFHSTDARDILKKYEVGAVEGTTEEDWDKLESPSGGSSAGGGIPGFFIPLLIVLLAVFYQLNKTYKFV